MTFQAKQESKGRRRDGYPALSAWMSTDPDDEGFIFRRFSRLSARNLLHLQSQVLSLEHQLDELDQESRQSQDVGLRRWETFADEASALHNEPAQRRQRLYETLEERIKAYHQALLLQASISKLHRPRSRVLLAFQDWFHGRMKETLPAPILNGRAITLLDDPQDLVALHTPEDEDLLSRVLQDHWPFPGHQSDPRDGVAHFQERHVVLAVAIINVIVSAILLVGPIVTLYIVKDAKSRLAMIAGFTAFFALSVAVMTNARRGELFASSAAYAAVLVVFISGNS
ncbi:hypothetical protein ASPZODRAFT_2031448 [Penicilliopsis zonata CBS 506.65]|uniref:DUF6594 domain-containing protein n=1 Tax=Penicilliopsis zonata CBS 506.65 TaxID=1073090 RepID=A0A1L9SHW0_9EURO|nr:hypothetical protein ASPZODRAFT_2031448 [Penicilliopsis zonata CBS 506.65]OJJ46802.1 hypothetical protein ASPZODRAFT_2031448 [Penicilliopsis zonata CBS 506.65]